MKKHLNLAAQKNPAAGKSFIHGLPFLALAFVVTALLAGWTFPLFSHWSWGGGWPRRGRRWRPG